jgi:hypothetical protein
VDSSAGNERSRLKDGRAAGLVAARRCKSGKKVGGRSGEGKNVVRLANLDRAGAGFQRGCRDKGIGETIRSGVARHRQFGGVTGLVCSRGRVHAMTNAGEEE